MSVEAIAWALKQPIERSSAKFVLVVMANCADGKEFLAWPSTSYLAECTSQDRKTVLKNIGVLAEMGLIVDTGERKGDTKQIPVYRLNSSKNGTVKKPNNSTENGTVSTTDNGAEIGTVKESQKRNSPKNGTVPFFPSNSTVFPLKQSQKRDTEPSEREGTVKTTSRDRSDVLGADDLIADGVDAQHARDWLTLRKAKKLPLTPSAWKTVRTEGEKVGMTAAQTVAYAVGSNWAGFKAAWFAKDNPGLPTQQPNRFAGAK
ncbi:helix-turn-helix domain-containing protein [Ralstonia sp. CP]|uniref:helix-turn-helix domain-containing protein n=1 Tax=Ralstonia sp. CP TaxID=3231757 RepID=UPI00345C4EB6